MLREAKIMSQYCHPNVIEFFGVTYDHPPTLLLMEYCRGGSLEDLLRRDHAIPEHELLLYCFEVCSSNSTYFISKLLGFTRNEILASSKLHSSRFGNTKLSYFVSRCYQGRDILIIEKILYKRI